MLEKLPHCHGYISLRRVREENIWRSCSNSLAMKDVGTLSCTALFVKIVCLYLLVRALRNDVVANTEITLFFSATEITGCCVNKEFYNAPMRVVPIYV